MIALAAGLCLGLVLFTLGLVLWNVVGWPATMALAAPPPGRISVLIPARNEASNIAECLGSAIDTGRAVHEIVVYDDRSSDETAQLVCDYAARDSRVRLVSGDELPAGWCGKNYACARLAAEARTGWLLSSTRMHACRRTPPTGCWPKRTPGMGR